VISVPSESIPGNAVGACKDEFHLSSNARVVLLDYGKYQFLRSTAALLRANGVSITYIYNSAVQAANQDSSLSSNCSGEIGIGVRSRFEKYSPVRRWMQEIEWANNCIGFLEATRPTILFSANTPLDVQKRVAAWCRRNGVLFVFWVQDILGVAIRKLFGLRWPLVGDLAGRYYERLEAKLLRESDHVILISEDHCHLVETCNLDKNRVLLVPNWAIVEEFPELPKDNEWSREHSVSKTFNFVYSGTLGMKHNPNLLLKLAQQFSGTDNVRIIVISEGLGADRLRSERNRLGLNNLVILPFQSLERVRFALASADVLLALLDRNASTFCVPSKVLTYLCTGRPLLLAIPSDNRAARLVSELKAGIVVPPESDRDFLKASLHLFSTASDRKRMGERARCYAEREFRSEKVCRNFMKVVRTVLERHGV